MPVSGGASDKAGNSYERRWTVFALIDLLAGSAEALRIEVPGDTGVGSEFRLVVGGVAHWHQAKRQRAAGPWSVAALVTEGVLGPWQRNLALGDRCVFVSGTGADELRELSERATAAQTWEEFRDVFSTDRKSKVNLERLRRAWPELADESLLLALRQVTVRTIGESELAAWIIDRLKPLVVGLEPQTIAAVLAQLADDSLHIELTPSDVWTHLSGRGAAPRNLASDTRLVAEVRGSVDAHLNRLRTLYIGGRVLHRSESDAVADQLDTGRRVIVTGAAGAGKSVVMADVIGNMSERGWPMLVLSADRLPEAATATQLGLALGLPDSPVTILAAISTGADALLVIDQLDAVSVTSGRHPEHLDVISDLLREALGFPNIRVLLACRQFDIDHDRALRGVLLDDEAGVVHVGSLSAEQVTGALVAAGLPTSLPPRLASLLVVPLHLALYVELLQAGVENVGSARTLNELYDRYWDVKRNACRSARDGADDWILVVERLVGRMNDQQSLSIPQAVVDDLDQQVKVMASEGVLTVSQGRVAFFHETFFDYCFARQFLAADQDLRELLGTVGQDLFRRAQVRQILSFERSSNTQAYLADLAWLLTSPDVRLHIKSLVVALFDTVAPTAAEWQLLQPIASDPASPLHLRTWQAIRNNSAWFDVLDRAGAWQQLLRGGGEQAERALWALTGADSTHPARVRELLENAPSDVWPSRRRWVLQIVDVHRAREYVDILLGAIEDGEFDEPDWDFEHTLDELGKAQPAWGAEVLEAYLRRTTSDDDMSPLSTSGERGRRRLLDGTDEIRAIGEGAPREFVDRVLPYLLGAMEAQARPEWQRTDLVPDDIWTHRIFGWGSTFADALFDAAGKALARLAEVDAAHAAAVFRTLRTSGFESAAVLLARGLAGNPPAFADEAADWLSSSDGARHLGYNSGPAWISRELVAAISPYCSPAAFEQLVDALLFYAPPLERTKDGLRARGYTELCLLNGLDVARRPRRVVARLAELARKFHRDDVSPPEGPIGGAVPPPIPEERARRMSDANWLDAMRHYSTTGDSPWRGGRFVGDAWSQSQVLESVSKEDPERFARLLLRLSDDIHEAYISAILRGITEAHVNDQLLLDVCRRVRDLGMSDANRWLVRLIESHSAGPVADELVETVAAIATGDPDPAPRSPDDEWESGSIDSATLNSTRSAAAFAIGNLLAEDPGRLSLVEPTLHTLAVDPNAEVRVGAVVAITPLLYSTPDLGLALFHLAVRDLSAVALGSRYVERFLHHAVQVRRYADIAPVLTFMLKEPGEDNRQAAARQLSFAAFYDPDLDAHVDALLIESDVAIRAAVVSVVADNITYAARRDRSVAVISLALHDSDEGVRDAAARAFYNLGDEPLTQYVDLITAFAQSPALKDGAASALHSLESSRHPLPTEVLDVCEAFVAAHESSIGDIRTAAAGGVSYVVRLVLRMHSQHTDQAVRERCLDLIDKLVVFRAFNIESDLDTIER